MGKSADSNHGNNRDVGLNQSGPVNSGVGLSGGENANRNSSMGQEAHDSIGPGSGCGPGPFNFGASREGGLNGQENGVNGEKGMDKESLIEDEESGSGGDDGDVVMESVFPSENTEVNDVEAEFNNTIRTGEALGVRLEDYKKEVENLVNGDGVIEGSQ